MSSENALHLWVCAWHDDLIRHHLSARTGMRPIQTCHLDATYHRFDSSEKRRLYVYFVLVQTILPWLTQLLPNDNLLRRSSGNQFSFASYRFERIECGTVFAVGTKSILARRDPLIVLVQAFRYASIFQLFLFANICAIIIVPFAEWLNRINEKFVTLINWRKVLIDRTHFAEKIWNETRIIFVRPADRQRIGKLGQIIG